jgi:hypothetical protein
LRYGYFPNSRTQAQRKADARFRWKTTMVHGDDNSSLPQMAFVSHSPCCLGVLVFAGLLTLPSHPATPANPANVPVLETHHWANSLEVYREESPLASVRFGNAVHQPNPLGAAMPGRVFARLGKSREALSKAIRGGTFAARKAGIETRHRFARLTGRQRPRGESSRGPDTNDGRPPFALWDGFPPSARFS